MDNEYWYGRLVVTVVDRADAYLQISTNSDKLRTIFLSAAENRNDRNITYTIKVGDSLADSKPCFSTSLSMWYSCDGLAGSSIYVTTSFYWIVIYEVKAFEQYCITPNAWINNFTTPEATSSPKFFLNQEMKINTGSAASCYVSDINIKFPHFISLGFKASIEFKAIDLIGMPPEMYPPTQNSSLYSANITAEVYLFGVLQGTCTPLTFPYDPLFDSEQDCDNLVGNEIKFLRKTKKQLGLCGGLILSDCDCTKTKFDTNNINSTYFYAGPVINAT
jgi:hypothetical protein